MVVQYSGEMFGEMSLMLLAFAASAGGLFPGVTTQVAEELDGTSRRRWHRRGASR